MSEFLIKEIQENPEVQKDFVEYMHERDKEMVPLFDEFQTQINNFNIKSLEEFAAQKNIDFDKEEAMKETMAFMDDLGKQMNDFIKGYFSKK